MEEESKAIKEVAKTTGKAIDTAREAGGFISKFIAGPLEQGVGIFEDKLKYIRWERQVRLTVIKDTHRFRVLIWANRFRVLM